MDRFQWEDKYTLNQDLSMTLTEKGVPGSNSNRLDSAEATTLFIQDEWSLDALVIAQVFATKTSQSNVLNGQNLIQTVKMA